MKILITGAAGQLGRQIIEQLFQRLPARQIVAGVRRMEQAALFRELGIEVCHVDYDQPESLDEACRGISRLLLISSSHTDDDVRLAQHKRVIDEAKRGGAEHLLYTGFAFPRQSADRSKPENVHTLTEQAILESGLGHTFLRNGLYMDFLHLAQQAGYRFHLRRSGAADGQTRHPAEGQHSAFYSVERTGLTELVGVESYCFEQGLLLV